MTTMKDLTAWAKKARYYTHLRDAAIHAMHAEGASLRQIGEAAGLSHTAIAKIVKRS